ILHSADKADRLVDGTLVGSGAVSHRQGKPVTQAEAALVPKRHRVPVARLQDHELVRGTAVDEVPRAPRTALFLDRANHGKAATSVDPLSANGRDRGGHRALRVDGAPAEEPVAIASHRDESGHGVDMAKEHHLARAIPPVTDDVTGLIAAGGKTHAAHSRYQPLAECALLRRWARNRQHFLQ